MSRSSIVLILVVVALVNMPLVLATWTRSSVERNGVEVQAEINETKNLGTSREPSWWLSYTLPESIDPEQARWSAEVDAATYEEAERDGTVAVTAVEGEPESAIVAGEVRSSTALVGTLVADAVMLAWGSLLWRSRGGRVREVMTLEALEDVAPAVGGGSWEDLVDGTVRVRGVVLEADQHEVLLELGDRLVRVVLDGHAGAVDVQQGAQVRARRANNPNGPTNPATR
ncbi:MAG: hypothetical protein JWN68_2957 [Nocardioides sp.]|jgi:hypothetical protein|uniref:hypothetical protein n=1 Tax=Nocardioides sp. TaxID=35761 RepID=UPI002608CBD0|nr:hypothetical protein [Nocardioides sp.]MCW2835004.1 hypothetical protein [Nocardioides sp.]